MNALQLKKSDPGSPPELSLTNLPKPSVKDGFVLVKVAAAAVWPSDKLNAKGGFPNTSFPRVPGRDFSGVIVDGPSDRIGEEVFGSGGQFLGFALDGTHAEYCLVPSEQAVRKPKPLSFAQAAAVGVTYGTALLCLNRAKTSKSDIVLVLGASGAVGSAAVQVAKAKGCQVLGASRRDEADVNTAKDPELATVKTLTDGKGVDVIVDTIGNLALMSAAVKTLAFGGRYTFIAAPRGGDSTVYGLDIFDAYRNGLEFIGCNSVRQTPSQVGALMTELYAWFEDGAIAPKAESEFETFALQNATQAYATSKAAVIKMDG